MTGESLLQAVDRAAVTRPGHLALDDSRRSMTYAELVDASRSVASVLTRSGVCKGDRVAVVGDKRVETVAAMLGAMRCGAVFVPLDLSSPPARLTALLADAAPRAVISSLAFEWSPAPLSFEDVLRGESDRATPFPVLDPDDFAYCLYTSGSTGRAKGVQIHHGALTTFVQTVDRLACVDENARCLNTSPFFFDASVIDVWFPLAKGATVYLSDGFLLPDRVLDRISEERMTHVFAVGSVLSLLLRARRPLAERDFTSVARVMTGAEVAHPGTIRAWLNAMPNATVVNGYGPTEATCCCFAYPITRDNVESAPYPIGAPFPGTEVIVVDADDKPVSRGSVGELLLSGSQVTKGYVGSRAENRTSFLEIDGRRWYRTGDLVVEDDAGIFHFKGRRDHELKIRGYRIHPAEVMTALQQCSGVAEAHVTASTDEREERVLVAAVVLHEHAQLDAASLQEDLRAVLPDYMIPRRIDVMESLPKLPSGKVDDRQLAARLAASPAL